MKKSEKIIASVLTMSIGILLIVLQDKFIGLLMTLAGVSLIVLGLLDLFQHAVPPAVIKIVTGVLIIVCGWVLVEAVLYIASAILLIAGILLLYDKIKKRVVCDTLLYTALEYAEPSLFILIGTIFLFHQAMAIELIFIFGGIFALLLGGILLTNALLDE